MRHPETNQIRTTHTKPSNWQVLVVDDSLAILNVVAAILRREKALVVTLEQSPYRALEIIEAQPEAYDLLLTDFRVPGMNGAELAAHTKAICPSLPVLAITTTPDAVRGNEDFASIMAKPFSSDELLHEILYHARLSRRPELEEATASHDPFSNSSQSSTIGAPVPAPSICMPQPSIPPCPTSPPSFPDRRRRNPRSWWPMMRPMSSLS